MKFTIWFDQVNQTKFEIKADSKKEAIEKAIKEWNRAYKNPYPSYVQKED